MLDGRATHIEPHSSPESNRVPEHIPAAISDIGCEREINEDRYAVIDSPAGRAWIVCDGMGGSLGGDLAAQLAIDAIRRSLESRSPRTAHEALKTAVDEANRVIVLRRQNPAFSGMGTTIVAALVNGDELIIGHAGDSRAYIVRGSNIEQLTVDHTYVQDLVEQGTITEDEAMSHPQAHVLTRCLGAEPRLNLDLHTQWIWKTPVGDSDDKLVLCSDGLYSLVADSEIARIVSEHPAQEACIKLIELAKARGGYDNITLVVLPMGGQLRAETPEGPRPLKPVRAARVVIEPQRLKSKEDLGRYMFHAIAIGILGSILAAVYLIMQL